MYDKFIYKLTEGVVNGEDVSILWKGNMTEQCNK